MEPPPRGTGLAMSEMSATAHGHEHAGDLSHHGGVPTIDVDARGFEPLIERFRQPALIAAGAGWLLMLVGIFVMGIIINQINREFSSLDTGRLSSLKE